MANSITGSLLGASLAAGGVKPAGKFNMSSMAIDHLYSGMMLRKDGSIAWRVNELTEATLSTTASDNQVKDAMGVPIATFYRDKALSLSATNALIDLNLYAAQQGTDKQIAGAKADGKAIVAPAFEEIVIPATATDPIELSHTPITTLTYAYRLKGDGTLADRATYDATGTANNGITFAYDANSNEVKFTNAEAGDTYLIYYDYESERAVKVVSTARDYPRAGRFILDVMLYDTCDQETKLHGYVVLPNAKLDPNVDLSMATDSTHPLKINAQQDYCDKEKLLAYLIIPDDDED